MPDDKPAHAADAVPDPDEDDLSDLDDVLDEFAATKLDTDTDTTATAPGPSGPGRPPQPAASTAPSLSTTIAEEGDDFAKQLQAGMADLLGELDSNPEMQKQFEAMMASLADTAESSNPSLPGATLDPSSLPAPASAPAPTASSSSSAAPPPTTSKPGEESFQDTIRRTMERMQASGESASAAAASSSSSDDILAQMLREMEAGGFDGLGGGADGGSDEDFSKMLMGMMEQLTNKEVLYEPMRELRDKFPAWLAANRGKVSKEDLARYEEQHGLVTEIAGKFEERDYSDDSATHRQFIVDRMEKMQAAGAPPPDLVGDMSAAQEAMGEVEAGCPQQ